MPTRTCLPFSPYFSGRHSIRASLKRQDSKIVEERSCLNLIEVLTCCDLWLLLLGHSQQATDVLINYHQSGGRWLYFFSVFLYLLGDILWETSPSMQSDWGSLIREML